MTDVRREASGAERRARRRSGARYDGEVVGVVPVAERARRSRRARGGGRRRARDARAVGVRAFRDPAAARPTRLEEQGCDELARTIALEVGKPLARGARRGSTDPATPAPSERSEGRADARRDGARSTRRANGAGRLAVHDPRQPCGVVVAITPFNYPALLVAHKVGPALAAGNAVVLKPARQTPLTALFLTRTLLEAGLPETRDPVPHRLQARSSADVLCADPRVRKISFTGSTAVGEEITRVAGVKRLSLELGCELPADRPSRRRISSWLPRRRRRAATSTRARCASRSSACSSADEVYGEFVERLTPLVEGLRTGASARRATRGSVRVISEAEAMRVGAHDPRCRRGRRHARHRRRSRRCASSRRASSATSTRRSRSRGPSCSGRRSRSHRCLGHRRGDRAGATTAPTDSGRGSSRPTSTQRPALRDRGRLRLDPDQLVAALARGPDALRRAQGAAGSARKARASRGRGDDRAEDRGLPRLERRTAATSKRAAAKRRQVATAPPARVRDPPPAAPSGARR